MRQLKELPGPRRLPILGNAHQIRPPILHQQIERWCAQHGSPFLLTIMGRKFLAISDPEQISFVLRQRPDGFIKGPHVVRISRELGFYGVFTANHEAWKRQRRIVMGGLDPSHLRAFLPAIVQITDNLRQRWFEAADKGKPIDILADLMRYTVDVTTCLAFGFNLDTLRGHGSGPGELQEHLDVIFPTLLRRSLAAWDYERWLPRPGLQKHLVALQEAVRGFILQARAQLAAQPKLSDSPENMLQALVVASDRDNDGLSDEELAGNVLTLLLAGEDTTANTLCWLIWLMSENPGSMEAARTEVDQVLGERLLPGALSEISAMEYVEACAYEAMRLKPVTPLNILEAAQETVVGDVKVPKGTVIICAMRPAGLAPENFKDPDHFRPDRWMGVEGESSLGPFHARRMVMPFGAGPRVCPGRYLAFAEIKMVMGMLLANFEIASVNAPAGGPQERMSLTMSPAGLQVRLRRRDRGDQAAAARVSACPFR